MKQLIAILCSILIIFIYFVIKKDLINNIFFVKTMEVIILSISLLFIGITITKNIEKYFLLYFSLNFIDMSLAFVLLEIPLFFNFVCIDSISSDLRLLDYIPA